MDSDEPIIHHHLIDRLAVINGIVSGIALYPQVWIVLRSGSAQGVSSFTYVLVLLNSLVWLAYAIHRRLMSLAIASFLNIVASALLLSSLLLF